MLEQSKQSFFRSKGLSYLPFACACLALPLFAIATTPAEVRHQFVIPLKGGLAIRAEVDLFPRELDVPELAGCAETRRRDT